MISSLALSALMLLMFCLIMCAVALALDRSNKLHPQFYAGVAIGTFGFAAFLFVLALGDM